MSALTLRFHCEGKNKKKFSLLFLPSIEPFCDKDLWWPFRYMARSIKVGA